MENTPKPRLTPKDFFLHLLVIITLYASAINLGTILFQTVNLTIPDVVANSQYGYDSYAVTSAKNLMRTAISFLIVMFPVCVYSSWYLHKMYRENTEKLNLRIRKWFIYFTLFASTIVIMSSLIALVNNLLNGELTLRFFLKFLTVVVISSSVLGYYVWELKRYSNAEKITE